VSIETAAEAGDAAPVSYDWRGLADGCRGAISLAGLVMACSFVGFGAFAHALGFGLVPAIATTIMIWALPGQVVFIDLWTKGAGLLVIALAVSLTAVRLLPMSVLVLSRARLHHVRRWPEFLAAHFIAITVWVLAASQMEAVPKRRRVPWIVGIGATLTLAMVGFTTLGYVLADTLPPLLGRTLVFFTPAFFLIALFGNARWRFDYLAIAFGAGLAPVAAWLAPDFDLLIAGVVGGTAAFFLARPKRWSAP
jgi:predicted branched-subunit amino acid permease